MPQSEKRAIDLINQAFNKLGVYTVNETPSSSDVNSGLNLLNYILDGLGISGAGIPFFGEVSFTMTPGKGEYTFSNATTGVDVTSERIAELDFVNLIFEDISYPVEVVSKRMILRPSRQLNLNTWPERVYLQRGTLKSTLIFYPNPQLAFECKVTGKFLLDELELFTQLDEVPRYYYPFLILALARELKDNYQASTWTAQHERDYKEWKKEIKNSNDFDLSLNRNNTLRNGGGSLNRYYNGTWAE